MTPSARLNRNAENDLALLRECVARGVRLLVDDTVGESLDTPTGKLMFGLKAVVAEHYRNEQSARMKAMFAPTFEQGGQRGADPFGYAMARDQLGRVVHPRQLVVVSEQADVVRRIFEELASRPFSEISDRPGGNSKARCQPALWRVWQG